MIFRYIKAIHALNLIFRPTRLDAYIVKKDEGRRKSHESLSEHLDQDSDFVEGDQDFLQQKLRIR